MVRSLGADQIIDYTREDFTKARQRYDLIFDVAAKLSFSACKHALAPQGIYVTTEFSPVRVVGGWWASLTGDKKLVAQLAKPPNEADLALIRELLESGQVRPVIDKRYELHQAADALRHLGTGHVRGKVIITM